MVRRIGFLLFVLGAASCRKDPPPDDALPVTTEPAPSSLPPITAPIDRLDPGELVEGSFDAYGVKLPRDLAVEASFGKVVVASGSPSLTRVANYVKARVREGTMTSGEGDVQLDGVRSRANPARVLSIHLEKNPKGPGTRLEIRDVTPEPREVLPNDEARYRAMGIDSQGRILNPKTIE